MPAGFGCHMSETSITQSAATEISIKIPLWAVELAAKAILDDLRDPHHRDAVRPHTDRRTNDLHHILRKLRLAIIAAGGNDPLTEA